MCLPSKTLAAAHGRRRQLHGDQQTRHHSPRKLVRLAAQGAAFHLAQLVGAEWGKQGYFTMPYAYLADRNLSDDFWTMRKLAD